MPEQSPRHEIRPFRRADRDQVTALVNTHAAAVLPGAGASVNAVLGQFEREPGELVVDPWVAERRPLVAVQDGGVVAAALVLRYRDDPDVGPRYRGAGELRWLVFRPMAPAGNPYWRQADDAAQALLDACLRLLERWGCRRRYADGTLPVAGVYGVPEQWPHVEALYARNGFLPGPVEVVHLLDLARLAPPGPPPLPGVRVRRLVGINGTRFAASAGGEALGYVEVDVVDGGERHPRGRALADVGNLHVGEGYRRRGVATWLLAHAGEWLRLAGADRLLDYTRPVGPDLPAADDDPAEQARAAFLARTGFVEVTRTRRGWELPG